MKIDNANTLSTFASAIADDPARLLIADAAFALGKSEADLARLLGVSRATLSSWKVRGAIPAQRRKWFEEQFPIIVLGNIGPAPGDDFRHAGLETALKLLDETDFNPFKLSGINRGALVHIASIYLGGLVRLSQFLNHRLMLKPKLPGEDPQSLTVWVMMATAAAAAEHILPAAKVSQWVSQSN